MSKDDIKNLEAALEEIDRLRQYIEQLKADLGHNRNNSYAIGQLRLEIDRQIALIEADKLYKQEPVSVDVNAPVALIQMTMGARMAMLKHLRRIAHDASADLRRSESKDDIKKG